MVSLASACAHVDDDSFDSTFDTCQGYMLWSGGGTESVDYAPRYIRILGHFYLVFSMSGRQHETPWTSMFTN